MLTRDIMRKELDGVETKYNAATGSYRSDPYGLVSSAATTSPGYVATVRYDYDRMLRPSAIAATGANPTTYARDGLGRLASIPGWLSSASYDAAGRLTILELANGTSTGYEYDARGDLVKLANSAALAPELPSYEFTWDAYGNIVQRDGCNR